MNSNSYSDACKKLSQISMFGSKPGLSRIKKLLSLLGNPQKKCKCILVGGTNGKGSTAIFLSEILRPSKKNSALFLSPHIFSIRERIQINGESISEAQFADLFYEVYSYSKEFEKKDEPTFFELITAMAFLHFAREKAEFAVMEVGMGGRLDATNACEPVLSIITSIGLEHTSHLGKTTTEIAYEKSGIMRKNIPAISAASGAAANEIKNRAKFIGAKLFDAHDYFKMLNYCGGRAKFSLIFPSNKSLCAIRLGTPGKFQAQNGAMAAIAADLLGIKHAAIINALSCAQIPARWQTLPSFPQIIIDCAHNPSAFDAISADLENDFGAPLPAGGNRRPKQHMAPRSLAFGARRALIFGAMKDKNWQSEIKNISKYFDFIILPRLPFERAADAQEIKNILEKIKFRGGISIIGASSALAKAKSLAGKNGKILCIGSIYMLGHLFSDERLGIMG